MRSGAGVPVVVAGTASLAIVGLFAAWALGGETRAADPVPTGTVRDLFGINEAISVPGARAARMTPAEKWALVDERIALTTALGVRHVRVHTSSWPHTSWHAQGKPTADRGAVDTLIGKLIDADLEPLVMIGPWPGNAPALVTEYYEPADIDGYEQWVKDLVERYDGDGVDDAPGIGKGVRAWEIDNEPDLHATTPPRGQTLIAGFSTADQYARIALITNDAIHAADPSALVLPAGLYAPAGARTAVYAKALWGNPEFAGAFSATNTHSYPKSAQAAWDGEYALEGLAPGRSRWVTEVSIGDEHGQAPQAEFLASLYLDALETGIQRVYWHSLREPPLRDGSGGAPERPGPHPSEGNHLYASDGAPKLAAQTMQRMIAVWGEVPRADVARVAVDGAHAVRIGEDLAVWGGVADVPITATDAELAAERLVPPGGAAKRDGPAPFTLRPLPVQDGRVHVDASTTPVRVVGAFPRTDTPRKP